MIAVDKLAKLYSGNPRPAVSNLSFEIAKGRIVGFLGPNGAGKSTTMRILAGVLSPTRGTVSVDGHSLTESADKVRSIIGYMPEGVPLHLEMRVIEYLRFRAEVKEVPRARRASQIEEAMQRAHVVDVANATIGTLSKGYRQRVGLADALVAKPKVLILDEPTAGLDPNQIREVRTVLRSLAGECTVLLSTHILAEVEASCDEAIVIDHGKLVAAGTLDEIRRTHAASELVVRVSGGKGAKDATWDAVKRLALKVDDVDKVEPQTSAEGTFAFTASLKAKGALDAAAEQLAKALVEAGYRLQELRPGRTSLEDVFSRLTKEES